MSLFLSRGLINSNNEAGFVSRDRRNNNPLCIPLTFDQISVTGAFVTMTQPPWPFDVPDLSNLALSEPPTSTNRDSWTKDATAGSDEINSEVISSLKDLTVERREPILPCKYIPLPRYPVFCGWEDTLATIRKALLAPTQDPENVSNSAANEMIPSLCIYSLCGPGGVGKTSIANEFVHRYSNEFDAVFWVTADEEMKLFKRFREVALKLGIVANTDRTDLPAIR